VTPRARPARLPRRDPFAAPGGWAIGRPEPPADGEAAPKAAAAAGASAIPVTPPAKAAIAAAVSRAAHAGAASGPDARALKRERIVDVLWELQRRRGWLDDEAVRLAAAECDLTPQEVDEVATFYNLLLRRPAGRRTVFVCDSISCVLNGGERLMAALGEALGIRPGEVTADGELGLLPIVCLGHCERAPCLLAGETVHGPCAADRAAATELVEKIRRG
jgi:NADH-quinone oxidoreductase subunit E